MSNRMTLRTSLCDRLGIEYPIILAGMGNAAKPELVAAVSNAGGLGVLGNATPWCEPLSPEQLRAEIRRVREMTDKPFGVDLILPAGVPETAHGLEELLPQAHRDFTEKLRIELGIPEPPEGATYNTHFSTAVFKDTLRVVCEEKVPVFASGLGLADWTVPICREAGTTIISVVGNVKNARRVADTGADIVVAQGYDGGGHTGRVGTFSLVPQVVDALRPLPVVAAGGVADGRGLAAALALGAVGVWCGSAFLATNESPIARVWKEDILKMNEEGTRVTKALSGKTCRMLPTRWNDAWDNGPIKPLPFPLQNLLSRHLQRAIYENNIREALPMPVGQIGGMIKEIKPAAQVVAEMVAGAVEILANSAGLTKGLAENG